MKGRILSVFRNREGVVSGAELSARLGISRVSVWKHIQKLKELGYPVASTAKGYRLTRDIDALFPWEFPGREAKMHYFDRVGSTMEIARDLARKDCPDFTVVVAGRQEKGRGRLDRTWLSDTGGLYFTVVLRPRVPAVLSGRVNFAASLNLARTLRRMFDIPAAVKWPNDILVDDKKICGMLSEMEASGDMATFVNIGMGVNVNNDPAVREPGALSLKALLGRQVSRKALLSAFLDEFEHYMNAEPLDRAISEWKRYAGTLNRPVRVVTTKAVFEGFARDVDENGALVLELADGSLQNVVYGDCFHA